MELTAGQEFTMARAQVVYQDTCGGTNTVAGKGTKVKVINVHPKLVVLQFEGNMYEVARIGCYALMMAVRKEDFDGWVFDTKKDVYRKTLGEAPCIMEVRPSVARRLLMHST